MSVGTLRAPKAFASSGKWIERGERAIPNRSRFKEFVSSDASTLVFPLEGTYPLRSITPRPQLAFPRGATLVMDIFGEKFSVEEEEGWVYIVHPRWSLVGSGATLPDAIVALYAEAAELAEVMPTFDQETMSPEAKLLQEFVAQFA